MTLGERLRKARGKRTQEEVAKRLGVDFTTISKWENDKSSPNIETLIALAELYETPVREFFNGWDPESTDAADVNTELVDAYNRASPEAKERILQYLRGDVREPFSDNAKNLMRDAESLSLEDIAAQYKLTVGGRPATPEEIAEAILYIKAQRIMKAIE